MKVRFLIYATFLALLPLVSTGYNYLKKRAAWRRVECSIQKVQLCLESKQSRQAINQLVRQEMAGTDKHLFSNLSELRFLEKEAAALERLFASRLFTGNEAAEKRYAFITGLENQFEFSEGATQDFEGVVESEVFLMHPVEVDTGDIKNILNHFEERPSGPQLIFTDWKLTRKETGLGSEVYELNLKLLKREFHS